MNYNLSINETFQINAAIGLFAFLSRTFGRKTSHTGNIYDSQTRQALAGVSIKTSDNKLLTVSDKNGCFK
ncbi:hypothetical protein CS542_05525 [Pedobacter sp. IW39]|nr:hypothetical protein CS542_05525 [Pedobacter sp. IW39]